MDKFLNRRTRFANHSNSWIYFWIVVIFLFISLNFAFWIHSKVEKQSKPNLEKVYMDYQSMQHPVFYQGQYDKTSAIGSQEKLKLPLSAIQQWIDPSIRYETDSESVIIVTSNNVFRFQTNQSNASLNQKPMSLSFTVEKIDDVIYLPIEPLMQIYHIVARESDQTGAIILHKPGDTVQWGKSIYDSEKPMRTGDSVKYPILSYLSPNERVLILREQSDWYEIQQLTGQVGFIPKSWIALDGLETIPVVNEVRNFTPWKPLNEKINMTWEYVANKKTNLSQIHDMPGVNVVSPTWFKLADKEGNITHLCDSEYVSWAKKRGYQIWALFSNQIDPELTSQALAGYDKRMHIIQQLLFYADSYQLDGINLDFENIYYHDQATLSQFVRELSPFLHAKGLVLSIDVTVKSDNEQWSMVYDRPTLMRSVDYMMVMAYDEHWASSPEAGSVASLPWVEKSLLRLLYEDQLPPEKIILGIPYYTRIWTEQFTDGEKKVSSKAVSMEKVDSIIKQKKLIPHFDLDTGQDYVEYTEGKKKNKIWIENETSLKSRIEFVHKYQLAGIASWRRGLEKPTIWSVLQQSLSQIN
jgi:spore germination protein YaaH